MKKIIFLALMGILTLQSVNAQRKGEKPVLQNKWWKNLTRNLI